MLCSMPYRVTLRSYYRRQKTTSEAHNTDNRYRGTKQPCPSCKVRQAADATVMNVRTWSTKNAAMKGHKMPWSGNCCTFRTRRRERVVEILDTCECAVDCSSSWLERCTLPSKIASCWAHRSHSPPGLRGEENYIDGVFPKGSMLGLRLSGPLASSLIRANQDRTRPGKAPIKQR